jgi:hypothetical protein
MGFTIGAFFVLVGILWNLPDTINKLQQHTWIGIGFILYFLICCFEIIYLIQDKIQKLEKIEIYSLNN